ncbi:MAG: hypothetical protein ACRDYU_07770, partial [Actinomycetes bacterium]
AAVRPVVGCHTAHLAALGRQATPRPRTPDGEEPTPRATPTPPPVPGDEDAARRALARAERQASRATVGMLGEAPGTLARLLASIGAAAASHHALLTTAPATGGAT